MIIVTCPHCKELVIIEEVNCAIFRHAVYKSNGEQINPHSTKEVCDNLLMNNQIYGCSKPFKIIQDISGEWQAIICDYI